MDTKFNTAFIVSGGGTRVMIYLGMYAALEQLNMKPDVLIATCGGAFASTVINTFPSNQSRKEYLKSEEYYRFATRPRLTAQKKLSKIGLLSLKKVFDKRNAPFTEDVFSTYLAEISDDFTEDFPSLKHTQFSINIPTLIIGSEILFNIESKGEKRNNKKLYQKVIFTDAETAKKINLDKIVITTNNYINSAVTVASKLKTDVSMLMSTRVSVSDMFYVAPAVLENKHYAGGAIDLIPIELASHIAENVVIENKQVYSTVEESLIRAVLGYSGNKRLTEVQNQKPDFQIDTRNIKNELEGHYIKKKIDWKNLEVCFDYPKSYEAFKKDMDLQWNYGYKQTIESIKQQKKLESI
ncbi:patatin-like phospholipase family protein [Cellulophaga baltica]|nr:patatin-like phospholipase family protein [Cellulophaga baltica]